MVFDGEDFIVKLLLVGVVVRGIEKQQRIIGCLVNDTLKIPSCQPDPFEFVRDRPKMARPIFRSHGVLFSIAPIAVFSTHDATIGRAIQIIPLKGPLKSIGRAVVIFVEGMEVFAGFNAFE